MTSILGALVVGLTLGLLGSGGSILTVPLLVFVVGHDEKVAIQESLAIVGIISGFGALVRARLGEIDWAPIPTFGLFSGLASAGVAALAVAVPGTVQLLALAVVMVVASGAMLRSSGPPDEVQERSKRGVLRLIVVGVVVGSITGFVGIGGGFLLVPALVLVAGVPIQRAVGTSLALITVNCVAGLVPVVASGATSALDLHTIAVFGGLGIVGTVAGTWLGQRIGRRELRRLFGVFILVLAGWILLREGATLWAGEVQPEPALESRGEGSVRPGDLGSGG